MISSFIMNVALVTLSLLSFAGMIWLTQFSFEAKADGSDAYTVKNFSKTKLTLCRITAVLVWIQMALVILGALWSAAQ